MTSMALEGIKVLDLSQHAPGPFATMILGDLGADVVHVSHPAAGMGPGYYQQVLDDPFMGVRFSKFDTLMRNKRSIQVDLKTPEGQAICRSLAQQADVMVVEIRPGKLAKLGLDYESLKQDNSGLIMCCISGYGATGPRAQEAGHDLNYIALTGALDLFKDAQGVPHAPQNILADYAGGGYLAVIGILAALASRSRTGFGQEIDVGMLDGALLTLADLLSAPLNGIGDGAAWRGTLGGEMPNYRCYKCACGGYVAVAALEIRFFETLLHELGLGELAQSLHDSANNLVVSEKLAARFAEASRDDWIERFRGKEVCLTPLVDVTELADVPQIMSRELIAEVSGIRQVAPAPKLSTTPARIRRSPSRLGSSTKEVLCEIGLSEAAIEKLLKSGIVGSS